MCVGIKWPELQLRRIKGMKKTNKGNIEIIGDKDPSLPKSVPTRFTKKQYSNRFIFCLGKATQSSYLLLLMISYFILVHSFESCRVHRINRGSSITDSFISKVKLILERTNDVPRPLGCFCSQITQPWNAKLFHFHSQLKQIVKAIQWLVMDTISLSDTMNTYLSHCVFAL